MTLNDLEPQNRFFTDFCESGIVNRQCGVGNTKYAVILDPLPTGHVTRRMRSELLAFNMGKCKFEALYLPNGTR